MNGRRNIFTVCTHMLLLLDTHILYIYWYITEPAVCLCVVATSVLYVVERLDIIAKQAALHLVVDSLRTDVRIGSDVFSVRLLLSSTGDINDVQFYHGVGVRDLHSGHMSESRVGRQLLTCFVNIFISQY